MLADNPVFRKDFFKKVGFDAIDKCWPWLGHINTEGYGTITFCGKLINQMNRVSYEIFKGPIPHGKEVCHTCDTTWCVNPFHLVAKTHKWNMQDRDRKGRGNKPKGLNHYNSRLSADEIRKIKKLSKLQSLSQEEIAERFGTSRVTVSRIHLGKTYAEV